MTGRVLSSGTTATRSITIRQRIRVPPRVICFHRNRANIRTLGLDPDANRSSNIFLENDHRLERAIAGAGARQQRPNPRGRDRRRAFYEHSSWNAWTLIAGQSKTVAPKAESGFLA